MLQLSWSSFAPANDVSFVMRQRLLSGRSTPEHTHRDYCELFWIRDGSGIHRINGKEVALEKGHLVWIRPDDIHVIRANPNSSGLQLTNIALRKEAIYPLKDAWKDFSNTWFWSTESASPSLQLRSGSLHILEREAENLAMWPGSQWRAERFMLNALAECELGLEQRSDLALSPDWLRLALEQLNTGPLLREGTAALYKLCGRSAEHVSRILKIHTGHSPTHYVNQLRLKEAARRLAMSDQPIIEIAADCGFDNLSYFYRLFKERYDRSPKRYREACLHPLFGAK